MCEVLDRAEQRGIQEGLDKGIYAVVEIYREDMGLDDRSIIGKVAARFGLTEEQAARYVTAGVGQGA